MCWLHGFPATLWIEQSGLKSWLKTLCGVFDHDTTQVFKWVLGDFFQGWGVGVYAVMEYCSIPSKVFGKVEWKTLKVVSIMVQKAGLVPAV